jgi:hypothetical protein
MVILETIVALPSMTYTVELKAYELNLGNEKIFNNYINDCKFLCINTSFYICIIAIIHVLLKFTKNKNLYIGGF